MLAKDERQFRENMSASCSVMVVYFVILFSLSSEVTTLDMVAMKKDISYE